MKETLLDSIKSCWTLIKILIPISILVKIAGEFGAIEYLGQALSAPMSLLGLPGEMGVVWGTAMLSNLYAGIFTLFSIFSEGEISIGQASIIASMMLFAHGLPAEGAIARAAGVSMRVSLVSRIGFAIFYGYILNSIIQYFPAFSNPAKFISFEPKASDGSLLAWFFSEIHRLGLMCALVIALHITMDILKFLGIIGLLNKLLSPICTFLGVSKNSSSILISGLLMGIAIGSGLILREVRKGHISKRDVFIVISVLGVFHAVIEDTLLMLAFGANLYLILFWRLLFVLAMVIIFKESEKLFKKFSTYRNLRFARAK